VVPGVALVPSGGGGLERPDTTRALLERLLCDDHDAWRELVRFHSGLLLEAARRHFAAYGFAASHHDIEDVVALVWQNLLANDRALVRTCRDRGSLLPTLHVLVRNRCVDLMRRSRTCAVALPDPDAVPAAESAEPSIAGVHPEHAVAALDKLPSRDGNLLRLFYLQDLKYRQISEITGIPMNSIGPLLGRALERLKQILRQDGPA